MNQNAMGDKPFTHNAHVRVRLENRDHVGLVVNESIIKNPNEKSSMSSSIY